MRAGEAGEERGAGGEVQGLGTCNKRPYTSGQKRLALGPYSACAHIPASLKGELARWDGFPVTLILLGFWKPSLPQLPQPPQLPQLSLVRHRY